MLLVLCQTSYWLVLAFLDTEVSWNTSISRIRKRRRRRMRWRGGGTRKRDSRSSITSFFVKKTIITFFFIFIKKPSKSSSLKLLSISSIVCSNTSGYFELRKQAVLREKIDPKANVFITAPVPKRVFRIMQWNWVGLHMEPSANEELIKGMQTHRVIIK